MSTTALGRRRSMRHTSAVFSASSATDKRKPVGSESLRTNRSISATTQMAKRGSASAAISSTERRGSHLYAIHSDKDLHTLLGKYGLLDDGDDGPSARTFDGADDSGPRVRLAVLNRALAADLWRSRNPKSPRTRTFQSDRT